MADEYIRKAEAVDAVAFGITIAAAFNKETGERIDLFAKENDELQKAIERIQKIDPADVAPVVRCKDCKFCCRNDAQDWYWCERGLVVIKVRPDDFCSYGDRREE